MARRRPRARPARARRRDRPNTAPRATRRSTTPTPASPTRRRRNGSFFDRLYAMRLANLPLYLLTIAMTWLLAGQLLGPALWPRTVAAGAVAVQPQFAFVVAGISPDPLLTAIWAVFLVVAVDQVSARADLARDARPARARAGVARHPSARRPAGVPRRADDRAGTASPHRGAPAAAQARGGRRGRGRRRGRAGRADRRRRASWTRPAARASTCASSCPTCGSSTCRGCRSWTRRSGRTTARARRSSRRSTASSHRSRSAGRRRVYDLLAVASLLGLVALAVVVVRARRRLRQRWPVTAFVVAAPLALLAALHFAAYRNLADRPQRPDDRRPLPVPAAAALRRGGRGGGSRAARGARRSPPGPRCC